MTMPSRRDERGSIYCILAKQVTLAVEECGMPLPDVSTESGIPEERIVEILDGQSRDITLRELAGLSLALGVSLPDLITDS
jgi:hypothetical protein